MKNNTYKLLRDEFGIAESILDLIDESEKQVSSHFSQLDDTMAYNQYRVARKLFSATTSGICTFHGIPDTATMIRDAMR